MLLPLPLKPATSSNLFINRLEEAAAAAVWAFKIACISIIAVCRCGRGSGSFKIATFSHLSGSFKIWRLFWSVLSSPFLKISTTYVLKLSNPLFHTFFFPTYIFAYTYFQTSEQAISEFEVVEAEWRQRWKMMRRYFLLDLTLDIKNATFYGVEYAGLLMGDDIETGRSTGSCTTLVELKSKQTAIDNKPKTMLSPINNPA